MTKLTEIYDKKFFEWHRPLKDDYHKIAKHLEVLLLPSDCSSVLDVGCGNAYFLEAFNPSVHRVGLEASHHCIAELGPYTRYRIHLLDASKPFLLQDAFSLVICTEVGEHLPEEAADVLVNNIFNHARRFIFFSAATPGQGGHDHINEQPHSYWIEKFAEREFVVDEERTKKIREFAATTQLSWIRDNAILFTVKEC